MKASEAVWPVLQGRQRAINWVRTNLIPGVNLFEMAITVAMYDDVLPVIDNLADGLPDDAIEWPSIEDWPFPHQPVLIVPQVPYTNGYWITSNDDGRVEEPFEDFQPVIASLIIPPGLTPGQEEGQTPVRIEDSVGNVFETTAEKLREGGLHAGQFGSVVDVHDPDSEVAVTHAWLPWGDKLIKHPREGGAICQSTRRNRALVQAIVAHRIVLQPLDVMSRAEARAVKREATSLQVLRAPRIGDSFGAGGKAPVLRHRDHYTADGLVKRALDPWRAQQIITEDPTMTSYHCSQCGKLHVGHRR